MKALAKTFKDDITIIVEVLSKPSATGLCKVAGLDGKPFARHVARLTPINEQAIALLKGEPCPS